GGADVRLDEPRTRSHRDLNRLAAVRPATGGCANVGVVVAGAKWACRPSVFAASRPPIGSGLGHSDVSLWVLPLSLLPEDPDRARLSAFARFGAEHVDLE